MSEASARARRPLAGPAWSTDERGAFAVFEAVMVAVLIFTAILFFTGIGRPTASTEAGGIDLGQNAADILAILASRSFGNPPVPMQDAGDTDGWVTNLVQNDATTRSEVDELVSEIVPSGALYILRLSNGRETVELAPGTGREPHGARAAESFVLPNATSVPDYDARLDRPGGNTVAYPVYGLQLVVWFGA